MKKKLLELLLKTLVKRASKKGHYLLIYGVNEETGKQVVVNSFPMLTRNEINPIVDEIRSQIFSSKVSAP